jgi:hypothetical protein
MKRGNTVHLTGGRHRHRPPTAGFVSSAGKPAHESWRRLVVPKRRSPSPSIPPHEPEGRDSCRPRRKPPERPGGKSPALPPVWGSKARNSGWENSLPEEREATCRPAGETGPLLPSAAVHTSLSPRERAGVRETGAGSVSSRLDSPHHKTGFFVEVVSGGMVAKQPPLSAPNILRLIIPR